MFFSGRGKLDRDLECWSEETAEFPSAIVYKYLAVFIVAIIIDIVRNFTNPCNIVVGIVSI